MIGDVQSKCPSSGFMRVQDWMKDVQIGFKQGANRALSTGDVAEVKERYPNGDFYRSAQWSQDRRWALVMTNEPEKLETTYLHRVAGKGGYYSVEVGDHSARLYDTGQQLLIHAELSHESLGWLSGCKQYFVVTSPTHAAEDVETLRYELSILAGLWVTFGDHP